MDQEKKDSHFDTLEKNYFAVLLTTSNGRAVKKLLLDWAVSYSLKHGGHTTIICATQSLAKKTMSQVTNVLKQKEAVKIVKNNLECVGWSEDKDAGIREGMIRAVPASLTATKGINSQLILFPELEFVPSNVFAEVFKTASALKCNRIAAIQNSISNIEDQVTLVPFPKDDKSTSF
jgi:hypothetical protein